MEVNQGQRARLFYYCFLVLTAAFLYLSLFRLPFTPIFTGGDDNDYLINAARMLEGQTIYRDFFEFVSPGLTVVNVGLFKLLGIRVWISEVLLIILGLGLTSLIVVISRKLLHGATAYLPAVLFLTCAFGFGLDDTEHWYSTLAELAAIAMVIERRTWIRLVASGAFCGLASFFMQTQGVFTMVGLAIFLLWEGRGAGERWQEISRNLGCLIVSFVTMVLAMNAYFVYKAGLAQFLYCTAVFPFKYYSADRMSNSIYSVAFEFRGLLNWDALPSLGVFLFIHSLLPLVYVCFWVQYRRKPLDPDCGASLMLLSIVGFLQCVGLASAPTTFRLAAVTAPGLILLIWLLRGQRMVPRVLNVAFWAVAACIAVGLPLRIQSEPMRILDLPRGRVAVDSAYYDSLLWWSQHTHPGEYVFAGAGTEILFPLALRDPAEVRTVTTTDFTRPEQVRDIVTALEERRVRFVFWDSITDEEGAASSEDVPAVPTRAYLRRCYRALKTYLGGDYLPAGDHLAPLRDYLHSRYHVVKTFSGTSQVWERNG